MSFPHFKISSLIGYTNSGKKNWCINATLDLADKNTVSKSESISTAWTANDSLDKLDYLVKLIRRFYRRITKLALIFFMVIYC